MNRFKGKKDPPPKPPRDEKNALQDDSKSVSGDLTPQVQEETEEQRLKREEEERKEKEEEERKRIKAEEKRKKEEEEKRIREEKEAKRKEEQEKRKEWENHDESKELGEINVDKFNMVYTEIPTPLFEAFHDISRANESSWTIPEVVIVGRQGSGKKAFLETILGFPLIDTSNKKPKSTKRSLEISMKNNPECETPKVTLQKDSFLKGKEYDAQVVDVADLGKQLTKRLEADTTLPIVITYESKFCLDLDIVDTPGLPEWKEEIKKENKEGNESSEEENEEQPEEPLDEIKASVIDIVKNSKGIVVFVEESQSWENSKIAEFAQKIDQRIFTRAFFVFTKFYFLLRSFNSFRELNQYLGSAPHNMKCFFISTFSNHTRSAALNFESFQTKISQSSIRDNNLLENLQFDRRYAQMIGAKQIRNQLIQHTWRHYQSIVPSVVREFKTMKSQTEQKSQIIRQQHMNLDNSYSLRTMANNYVSEFLQTISRLIKGSVEGNAGKNGQTLGEEKIFSEVGEWQDSFHSEIQLPSAKLEKIPNFNTKLFGKKQFERLLFEFRMMAKAANLDKVTMDEVGTATGIREYNDYVWAASDLAKRYTHLIFVPLISTLFERAEYVIKRLTEIADNVKDNGPANPSDQFGGFGGMMNQTPSIDMTEFPLFTFHVKSLFFDFVDSTSSLCQEKAMDECQCTQIISWKQIDKLKLEKKKEQNEDDKLDIVKELAQELFEDIKNRITKSVMLKCYDIFLVGMQEKLFGVIERQINVMSDENLHELFEVETTKKRFEIQSQNLETKIKKLHDDEVQLTQATTNFSMLRF